MAHQNCTADDESYCAKFPECECGGIPAGYYLRHTLDGDELVPIPQTPDR
jgi:hypothetical protein